MGGIPSIIIAANNTQAGDPDVGCSRNGKPPLPTWHMVYGIVVLVTAAIQIVCIILINKAKILFILVTLVVGLFMFAWNIVGAVSLFRDSGECKDTNYSLWAMTLAVLIIQWIGMLVNCCSGYSTK